MSHDETSGTVTRKERRAAYRGTMLGRKPAPRRVFSASDYIREDWTTTDLIEMLESRARGYNGTLRQVFCTAAYILYNQERALTMSRDAKAADDQETNEVVNEMREAGESELVADMAPIAPLNISKRNQQPGRLSGGERAALKKFVTRVRADTHGCNTDMMMAEGRALLTKVRKRALGGVEETVDCSALMPVGVEENFDEEAHYAAFGSDGDGA